MESCHYATDVRARTRTSGAAAWTWPRSVLRCQPTASPLPLRFGGAIATGVGASPNNVSTSESSSRRSGRLVDEKLRRMWRGCNVTCILPLRRRWRGCNVTREAVAYSCKRCTNGLPCAAALPPSGASLLRTNCNSNHRRTKRPCCCSGASRAILRGGCLGNLRQCT